MTQLYSLQGRVHLATRSPTTGRPLNHRWVGNMPDAELALETESEDKFESYSGNRLLLAQLQTSKGATFSGTFDELFPENLAIGLYGTPLTIATAPVAAEVLPSGLVVGSKVQLANKFASAIILTDSTGSPQTLTLNTHYRVESAALGLIEILSLSTPTMVQPINAAYTQGDATALAMFSTVTPPERYVVFDGINTLNGDRVVIELFRMQFQPVTGLALINESFGGLEINGAALFDELNAADANLGGFGKIWINKLPTAFV